MQPRSLINPKAFPDQSIAQSIKGNPGHSWVLDSMLRILDSRYWIPVFVCGTLILDSNR